VTEIVESKPEIEATNKQLIFAQEYVISGCDKAEAAKRAGYTASQEGSYALIGREVYKSETVQALIKEIGTRLEKRYELTTNRIGREMAHLAFFDIADILDSDGNVKPIKDIPPHARRVITGVEVEQTYDKNGKMTGKLKRVKLASKEKCLEMLARIQGMFNDQVKISGKVDHDHSHNVSTIDLDERIKQITGQIVEEKLPKHIDIDVELEDALS
jgi:phage terminase small subunit